MAESSLDGRVVLLTGGTSGIGRKAARSLADRGASVAIVGRDRERGRAVRREIAARNGDGFGEFYAADLAFQRSVRELAERFRARHDRLDVLVNNAGTFREERERTDDGIEATLAINHLAPYLLTHQLADLLAASEPARVLTITSGLHERGRIRFEDISFERGYDGWEAYSQSKLANVLFAYELAERLPRGVTSNAIDPGFVPTTALSREGSFRGRTILRMLSWLPVPSKRSVAEGANSIVRAVADPDLANVTGTYLRDGKPAPSGENAYDERTRRRLWDLSAGLVGVSPDSPPLQP